MSLRSNRQRIAASPQKATPPAPPVRPAAAPGWLPWLVLALAAGVLFCFFAGPVSDTDTWWHLKTGEYLLRQHRLPVPDPFSYTAYMGKPAYPGEEITRQFNLTHEWLAQIFLYGTYALGGFPGLVAMRALWLMAFCGLAGWIVWRRTGGFYRGVGAALAVMLTAQNFTSDRPQYITYVFLGLTILILESRRRLWLLPPLLLVWANAHAGFLLGWVAMGAYCGEALFLRLRGKPPAEEKALWAFSLGAILISGLNPNGFRVFEVMHYYRQSALQSQIWEWRYPKYWEMSIFTFLTYGAAAILLLNWRRTRVADWLLLLPFGMAGFLAYRNIILAGFVGAVLIASYLPASRQKAAAREWAVVVLAAGFGTLAAATAMPFYMAIAFLPVASLFWYGEPRLAGGGIAVYLAAGVCLLIGRGAVQLSAAEWKLPVRAADFLLEHHIEGRIFNTYGQGGYLLWRLWPEQQVFLDGRALNETVAADADRINMNAAEGGGGKSGEQLLKDYGIDVIVMDGFEPVSGGAYYLPAALADPAQKGWKLVYQDIHDVIYMRNPPPDVKPLNSLDALATMEAQCAFLSEHNAPACTRGMYDIFTRIGDRERARKWLEIYRASNVKLTFEAR
jgi:hypothetical protein